MSESPNSSSPLSRKSLSRTRQPGSHTPSPSSESTEHTERESKQSRGSKKKICERVERKQEDISEDEIRRGRVRGVRKRKRSEAWDKKQRWEVVEYKYFVTTVHVSGISTLLHYFLL